MKTLSFDGVVVLRGGKSYGYDGKTEVDPTVIDCLAALPWRDNNLPYFEIDVEAVVDLGYAPEVSLASCSLFVDGKSVTEEQEEVLRGVIRDFDEELLRKVGGCKTTEFEGMRDEALDRRYGV